MLKQQVPIIFAINKIDKPNLNPKKLRRNGMNLLVEDWGGKSNFNDISTGVKELEKFY
jgi:translation initiation factor IF-2